MFQKFKFPLSLVALIGMIFVWKIFVFDRFFPGIKLTREESTHISMTAIKIKGNVMIADAEGRKVLNQGAVIDKPIRIFTGKDSVAILGYGIGYASKIKIGPETSFDLSQFKSSKTQEADGLSFFIHKGFILFRIFNPSKSNVLKVRTPTMAMGIRGTTFIVDVSDEKSTLLVHEGKVEVESNKGRAEFASAGQGFEAKTENELEPVSLSTYNVDFNLENDSIPAPPEPAVQKTSSLDLPSLLDREVKRAQNNFEVIKSKKPQALQAVADKEKALNEENEALANDETCLQNFMRECEFTSEHFKNDIRNLKNNPTKVTNNPAIKKDLEKDFEKAKADVVAAKEKLKNEIDTIEAEFITEQSRVNEINAKYEQWKTADEATKKTLLPELDKLINSAELHDTVLRMNP